MGDSPEKIKMHRYLCCAEVLYIRYHTRISRNSQRDSDKWKVQIYNAVAQKGGRESNIAPSV